MLYSIGAFSRLCGVSIFTLRFWNKEKLLVPSNVDEKSGYRYYSAEQIYQTTLIRFMQDAGLKNSDIKEILATPQSEDRVVAVMRIMDEKQRELELLRERIDIDMDYMSGCIQDGVIPLPITMRSVPALHYCCKNVEYESTQQLMEVFCSMVKQLERWKIKTLQPYKCVAMQNGVDKASNRQIFRCMVRVAPGEQLKDFESIDFPAYPTMASVVGGSADAAAWQGDYDCLKRWLKLKGHIICGVPRLWFVSDAKETAGLTLDCLIETMVPVMCG